MKHRSSVLGLLALVSACATGTTAVKGPDTPTAQDRDSFTQVSRSITVERRSNTVIYRGSMTEPGLNALRKAGQGDRVSTLLIESAGGEIVVGMEFGAWVLERELDVVVDRACLSSCANYVFTAAPNKEIKNGAVVAWHGSAKAPGLLEQMHEAVEQSIDAKGYSKRKKSKEIARARKANVKYLTNAIRKQDEFFYRVGVDEYVTRVGNDKYGIRGFFYMSVADMASFGIGNVIAPVGYSSMDLTALASRTGYTISLVTID